MLNWDNKEIRELKLWKIIIKWLKICLLIEIGNSQLLQDLIYF